MARRQIRQEVLALGGRASGSAHSLDRIASLLDWVEIDRSLSPVYAAAKGEQAWPPLAMFKALLLSVWYDLTCPT
jgi:transposase, IS5 family